MPYKYIDDVFQAFQQGRTLTHKSYSVRQIEVDNTLAPGLEKFGLYSYGLLIGKRANGKISLLPIPGKDTNVIEGGIKTKALLKAAWKKFPGAKVLGW